MDIPPEILHLIAQNFDYRRDDQLLVCCRVSKSWYAAFIPLLMHTLSFTVLITGVRELFGTVKVHPDVIRTHGGLVRNMTIQFLAGRLNDGDMLAGITRLKSLSLRFYPRNWRWLRQFVANNPEIQELQLNNCGTSENFGYLKDLAKIAPQVQDFSLSDTIVEWSTLLHFLTACHLLLKFRLESSKVVYTRSQGNPSIGDATLSQGVRAFEFISLEGLTFSSCLDLAARCPQLESLTFSQAEGDTEFPFVSGDLSKIKHCSSLSTLSLRSHSLGSAHLDKILGHCRPLTNLTLETHLDLESIPGMSPHLGSLETLDLSRCSFGMLEAILSQCPKLSNLTIALNAKFDTDQFHYGRDGRLANTPRPWLSVGLKKLKIRSNIERLCRLWDTLAEPLMELKELESLVLDFFVPTGDTQMSDRDKDELPPAASWPWKTGRFEGQILQEDPDLQWVVEAWPKLRFFEADESDEEWPINKGWYLSESESEDDYPFYGWGDEEEEEKVEEEREFRESEPGSDLEPYGCDEEDEEDEDEEYCTVHSCR